MTTVRHVPFGPAPRPTSDAEIVARVRELLSTFGPPDVRGLDQVDIAAHLDGADLSSLVVDATGVALGVARSRPVRLPSVDVAHREPGVVRTFELAAHPASVADVPVDVEVAASNLHFSWGTTAENQLVIEVRPTSDDEPVVGSARISAPRKDIEGAARTALGEALREKGLKLTALDIELENRGPRALSLRATAKVQKSVMRAAVTATATASIDDALVLSISDARLVGSNPLVDGLLAPFRSRIAAQGERTVDLAALLPAGVSVSDVSVVAGAESVVVSVTLG